MEDQIYNEQGINFDSLSHMESIGLIKFNNLSGFKWIGLPKSFFVSYCNQAVGLTMEKEKDNDLPVGRVLLTKIGEELVSICKVPGVDGFESYVKKQWSKYKPSGSDTEQ